MITHISGRVSLPLWELSTQVDVYLMPFICVLGGEGNYIYPHQLRKNVSLADMERNLEI
jgi:hypothetical protein